MYGMVTSHSAGRKVKSKNKRQQERDLIKSFRDAADSEATFYSRCLKFVKNTWYGIKTLEEERDFDDLDGQQVHIKPEPIEVLCQLTKFSKQELQIMYRGFKQDCPSGVVKEDMFKVIYAQFFPRGSDPSSYAHYVFNSFDPDHTGSITFTDFVVGLSALARGSVQDKLRWAFNLYDLNGDGVLTKDEFSLIVSAVYDLMGKSVEFVLDGKEQTERVFRKFDQKQKGTINLQEFIDSCLKDESITKSLAALDTIF
ncbi:Kv channel-interacting protein 4-like isoform X2 [Panonychus citri]|uniref:Kv channel-interacting protein 4-like isoform X2 n=1 Tax=Panonychus citri TaxID=50023 RepID=UPI0023070AF9|nr:Kv channel-interacting protein 4-like isoform X2 [Panonychus citri]